MRPNNQPPWVLPATVSECQHRRRQLEREIASIKTQIATNDIRRQIRAKPVDPEWFHRTRTALNAKRHELLAVIDRQSELTSGRGRNGLRDAIIETVRADYDDDEWEQILAIARDQIESGTAHTEGSHG